MISSNVEQFQEAPLISIIMAVYNGERYVGDAIHSVLQQSYAQWELIVINDGSTDGTCEILGAYIDPRIKIIHQANRGVSAARNAGLKQMLGSFFCFLDADDVLPKDSLRFRLKIFENNPDIDFVDGVVKIFSQDLSTEIRQWKPSVQGEVFSLLIRLDDRVFFGPTWMIRRKGGVDYQMDEALTHGEDLFFYMGIAQRGQYAFTEEVILNYRKNPSSAMSNIRGLAKGYTKLRERIGQRFAKDISVYSRLFLQPKTRKIMFLTFWNAGMRKEAWQYLLKGKIHKQA